MSALARPAVLFVPALIEKYYRNIPAMAERVGAVVLDVEDAVAEHAKHTARACVLAHADLLRSVRQRTGVQILLRVNNSVTPFFGADMNAVAELARLGALDGIAYPKAASHADVSLMERRLAHGLFVFLHIEDMSGYRHRSEIFKACSHARWVAVGVEDFTATLGRERTLVIQTDPLIAPIVENVALSAMEFHLDLIGCVWPYLPAVHSPQAFRDEILWEILCGATGKAVFHPTQIEPVTQVFEEQARADLLTVEDRAGAAETASSKSGLNVALRDGRMAGRPDRLRLAKMVARQSR